VQLLAWHKGCSLGVRGLECVGVQECLVVGCCPLGLEGTKRHHSSWQVVHRVIPQRTPLHQWDNERHCQCQFAYVTVKQWDIISYSYRQSIGVPIDMLKYLKSYKPLLLRRYFDYLELDTWICNRIAHLEYYSRLKIRDDRACEDGWAERDCCGLETRCHLWLLNVGSVPHLLLQLRLQTAIRKCCCLLPATPTELENASALDVAVSHTHLDSIGRGEMQHMNIGTYPDI